MKAIAELIGGLVALTAVAFGVLVVIFISVLPYLLIIGGAMFLYRWIF